MLPDLKTLELGFKTSSAETYICDRKHLVEGQSYDRFFDYDIFLADGTPLQRPLVWTPLQQSEWIWSLIYERPVPPVAINHTGDTYEVIDGKQRLCTLGQFLRDEIKLLYGDAGFLFSELPDKYQDRIIRGRPILGYLAYDLSDHEKLQWFKWINYAGTPQDQEHISKLENLLK